MLSDPGEAVPGSPTHRLPRVDFRPFKGVILPIGNFGAQSLQPFGYDLPASCPTLNLQGHPLKSKDSQLGGRLAVPRRDSYPLEHATLPGRTERLLVA